MAEPEFSASGVRISKWPRSLTRAGGVVVRDGRLVLLTSRGQEIDSAPVNETHASAPRWYGAGGKARVALEGRRYLLRMGRHDSDTERRLLEALRSAREACRGRLRS
jgi:hypothetical protein